MLLGILLAFDGATAARAQCPDIQLPSLAQQAASPIRFFATDGAPASYYRTTLTNVPAGFSISNTSHRSWCIDYWVPLRPDSWLEGTLYNSVIDTLPPHLQSTNWDMVNFILNHKQGNAFDVQAALWHFVGGPVPPSDPVFHPPSLAALAMISNALANGEGYLPSGAGAVVAVVIDPGPDIQALIIEVAAPLRRPPVAHPDALTTTRDQPLTFPPSLLLANDLDPDGDPIAFVGASPNTAQGGTVTISGANLLYSPPANFIGSDSFTYFITDNICGTNSGTVNVTVRPPTNQPPVVANDIVDTTRDQPAIIPVGNVLTNDMDPDGGVLVVIGVSTNSAYDGIVLFDGTNIVYIPPPGFVGPDTFTYTVSDGQGGTATGTVTVNVIQLNAPPVAVNDSATTDQDATLTISATTLLANDSDPDGDPLVIQSVAITSARGGAVQFDGTNILYFPPPNFFGNDGFTYTISDGQGGTATATVNITILPPANRPPLAGNLTLSTPMNTTLTIPLANLLGLATDPDGDTVLFREVLSNLVVNGRVILDATNVIFFPPVDFVGPASFPYAVQDSRGLSATGAVMISVIAAALPIIEEAAVFNPQTGLFEQRVTVSNESSNTIAAFQLCISNLRTGIQCRSAFVVTNGTNFVQVNRAIDPNTSVVVRVEYYVPDRRPFTPVIALKTVMPVPSPATNGVGVAIDRSFIDSRLTNELRYVIEFNSIPSKVYTIIYSDDMAAWKAATPTVTATASRTQWYDDGPPKTDSRPGVQDTRFYRVIQAP